MALFALVAGLVSCGSDSGTEPHTASIVVPAIVGLPDGATATVTVNGPRGFHHVDATPATPDTLDALVPGAYTVTASDATIGGTRWSPSPGTQVVNAYDGFRFSAREISYAVSSARLVLGVIGLPAGAAASVRVTGPGGFARTVTATTTIEPLEPGMYTLIGSDVQAGGRTYHPGPSEQQVTLAAGETIELLVDHGTGSGTLAVAIAGIPGGTDATVTVTGPSGFVRTLTHPRVLEHLEPGTYTIGATAFVGSLASYTPTTPTQTRTLGVGAAESVSVDYVGTALELGLELVVEGIVKPSFVTAPAGDARLFIVEREGRVRIVKDGALLATPFLDIRSRVNSTGERGMLGLAFDPQYAQSGRFYVFYVDLSGSVVVERLQSTPGSDVAGGSGGIVISIPHGGSEHHGGMLAFGPDGMLYLGPGDGGCCGDPQNRGRDASTLLGKILRLDVSGSGAYTIPAGNPFVGRAGARPEIWAMGLRNPWRFSFDAPGGMLYIGDVGDNAREEVDAVPATSAGRDFGWSTMEGTACFKPSTGCSRAGLTMPVLEYTHADGCSVTGGYVYRGTRIPELTGHYLYADYCRGWLRSFRLTSDGAAAEQKTWGVTVPQALSFGRDGAGELYVVSGSGRIWRIVKR